LATSTFRNMARASSTGGRAPSDAAENPCRPRDERTAALVSVTACRPKNDAAARTGLAAAAHGRARRAAAARASAAAGGRRATSAALRVARETAEVALLVRASDHPVCRCGVATRSATRRPAAGARRRRDADAAAHFFALSARGPAGSARRTAGRGAARFGSARSRRRGPPSGVRKLQRATSRAAHSRRASAGRWVVEAAGYRRREAARGVAAYLAGKPAVRRGDAGVFRQAAIEGEPQRLEIERHRRRAGDATEDRSQDEGERTAHLHAPFVAAHTRSNALRPTGPCSPSSLIQPAQLSERRDRRFCPKNHATVENGRMGRTVGLGRPSA